MFAALEAALAELRRAGADHGEARAVDEERESIQVRFAEPERLQRSGSRGIAVRALVRGRWGFAARPEISAEAAAQAARDAVEVAAAAARVSPLRVTLA